MANFSSIESIRISMAARRSAALNSPSSLLLDGLGDTAHPEINRHTLVIDMRMILVAERRNLPTAAEDGHWPRIQSPRNRCVRTRNRRRRFGWSDLFGSVVADPECPS